MSLIFPALAALIILMGLIRRVDIYDAFLSGAKEGLLTAWRILPPMLAMLCAVRVFHAGGGENLLCGWLLGPLAALGLPKETIPLFLLKPLSGSASLAMLKEILSAYGPDSRAGLVACTMMGSSETVFYTCAVYLGAAKVKETRHILPCALAAWLAGALAAGILWR